MRDDLGSELRVVFDGRFPFRTNVLGALGPNDLANSMVSPGWMLSIVPASGIICIAPSMTRSRPATDCSAVISAPVPPMSVFTQPGCTQNATMPRLPSSNASRRVAMLSAALLTR